MIITEVNCDGYLAQLSEEIIDSYDTGGKAVTDIVTDLLAFQRKATKITKGTIAPTDTRALKVESKTILYALLQLKESIGGYIYVDNNRALQWATTIGEDKGQQIRYRKNLKGIAKKTNYSDLCTKLHPLGGTGVKLSDINVETEAAGKDSNDYGYINLTAKYACYKDWIEAGEALPEHITVYREGAEEYFTPTDHDDPDSDWDGEGYAYDGNIGSAAIAYDVPDATWTGNLEFVFTKRLMEKIRFHVDKFRYDLFRRCKVEITEDNIEWILVYSKILSVGEDYSEQWLEAAFDRQQVWGARIRFYNQAGYATQVEVNELEGASTYQDDTAKFVQGANERTLRCAIENFHVDDDYFISYTHAGYLIAWDKIVTDDNLISKTLTNKYEAYAGSLLEAGRLLLDEVKEVPISYSIRTVDLSESEALALGFEALQLGSIITVIDEELGIDVSVRVVKITHPDLLKPQNMEIEITNRLRDIADVIANMYRELG